LVCAVVVAVHALDRYNTPESNRVSTTRAAFLFTGAGYVSGLAHPLSASLPGRAAAARAAAARAGVSGDRGRPGDPQVLLRAARSRGGHPDGSAASHADLEL